MELLNDKNEPLMSPEEYSDVAKELVWEFNTNELVEALATTVVFILVAKLADKVLNEPLIPDFNALEVAIELLNDKKEPLISADEYGATGWSPQSLSNEDCERR